MNEAQVRTVAQVRQVLDGTQALEFGAAADDEGRYRWIGEVLQRLSGYRRAPEGRPGFLRIACTRPILTASAVAGGGLGAEPLRSPPAARHRADDAAMPRPRPGLPRALFANRIDLT